MASDDPNRLKSVFARAFRQLQAQMGREEMRNFCFAISKDEKFLELSILEPGKVVKDSVRKQRPRKRKRVSRKSERLDMALQNFKKNAVRNVKSLIEGYWHEFSGNPIEIINSQPEADQSIRTIRLNQHLALLKITRDEQVRWMWKGIMLIQHLRSHEAFLDESGYTTEDERNSQRARDQYIEYLYKGCELDKAKDKEARTGLSDHLRYGRRWQIFLDALTAGFIIVCGKDFAMSVICRTDYTKPDLKNLASQIKESRICRLCEVFRLPGEHLLNAHRLDDEYSDKNFVLAEVQRVSLYNIEGTR